MAGPNLPSRDEYTFIANVISDFNIDGENLESVRENVQFIKSEIEGNFPGRKVYIHVDDSAGKSDTDNKEYALQNSACTIVLVTRDLSENRWSQLNTFVNEDREGRVQTEQRRLIPVVKIGVENPFTGNVPPPLIFTDINELKDRLPNALRDVLAVVEDNVFDDTQSGNTCQAASKYNQDETPNQPNNGDNVTKNNSDDSDNEDSEEEYESLGVHITEDNDTDSNKTGGMSDEDFYHSLTESEYGDDSPNQTDNDDNDTERKYAVFDGDNQSLINGEMGDDSSNQIHNYDNDTERNDAVLDGDNQSLINSEMGDDCPNQTHNDDNETENKGAVFDGDILSLTNSEMGDDSHNQIHNDDNETERNYAVIDGDIQSLINSEMGDEPPHSNHNADKDTDTYTNDGIPDDGNPSLTNSTSGIDSVADNSDVRESIVTERYNAAMDYNENLNEAPNPTDDSRYNKTNDDEAGPACNEERPPACSEGGPPACSEGRGYAVPLAVGAVVAVVSIGVGFLVYRK